MIIKTSKNQSKFFKKIKRFIDNFSSSFVWNQLVFQEASFKYATRMNRSINLNRFYSLLDLLSMCTKTSVYSYVVYHIGLQFFILIRKIDLVFLKNFKVRFLIYLWSEGPVASSSLTDKPAGWKENSQI